MRRYTIGALAKAAHVRADTVRYYERIGLLPVPERTMSGYRIYDDHDLEGIRFIRTGQCLGFTLAEIRGLLALQTSTSARAGDVLRVTTTKIGQVEGRIAQLKAVKQALELLAAGCPVDSPVSDCPIFQGISNPAWGFSTAVPGTDRGMLNGNGRTPTAAHQSAGAGAGK